MAKVTAGEVIKRRTYTIRPFAGRNSETEAMSIESNQASSGTNFRIERGILRRRPSFSRIAGRVDRNEYATTGIVRGRVHQIVPVRLWGRTEIRLVSENGIYNLWSPGTSMTGGSVYPEPVLRSSYSAGTVALTSGSPTVTGTGTAWLTRGVHSGASFVLGSTTYTVRSVSAENSVTLTSNSSTTTSGAAYRMALYGASDFSVQSANRHMGVYPDPSRITSHIYVAATYYFSVSGGTTLGVRALSNESHTGQFTHGLLVQEVGSEGSWVQKWMRLTRDTQATLETYNSKQVNAVRKPYLVMTTRDGTSIVLNERFRSASGAYSPGINVNQGLFLLEDSNYYGTRITTTLGPGTISATSGSTTVTGVGTSFGASTGVAVGDELIVNHNRYRISSIGGATSVRIASPFDQSTVVSGTYGVAHWRNISSVTSPNTTIATGTLSSAVLNGTKHVDLFPLFGTAANTSPMERRIQTATALLDNPWIQATDPLDYSSKEFLFVCSPDASTLRHNIWWDAMPDRSNWLADSSQYYPITREFIPVSMVAPTAKLIEMWNGRLFAADVVAFVGGLSPSIDVNEQEFWIMWTRVNEPFSWWNQYATDGAGNDIVTNGLGAIKALKVLTSQNVMAVYREHGITIYYPTGDAINPFGSTYRDLGPGPVSDDAILEVPDGHLFLALDGHIKIFNGSTLADFPCTVLDYIRDNMTWAQAHWVQAVWEKNKNEYMWFIPTTTAQALTAAVVYNTTYGVWYVYEFEDTPLSCAAYIDTAEHTSERRIWAVTNDCHLVAFRDEAQGGLGFDFLASVGGGTGFSSTWESKDLALPIPETDSETRLKLVDSVELLYDSDPDFGGTVTVSVSPDGGETWTSFGNVSLRPGTVTGTRSTLAGGAQVNAVNHRVRLVQTPTNFNVTHSMAVKAVKIHYVDFGEATP